MLKVWGRRSSSNVQAVMWCVGELDLAHERIDAGFRYGVVDTPAYLELNPNGTVPTLVDGDAPPLWETGAILRYLASSYGDDAFWPACSQARAGVDKWAEWAKINVALNFTVPVFWQVVRTPPSRRDPSAIERALVRLDHFLAIADRQLDSAPFIAGPAFTLADIQFGHCLFRYYDIDISRATRPQLRAYYDRLAARPAFREHVIVSYEELRATD